MDTRLLSIYDSLKPELQVLESNRRVLRKKMKTFTINTIIILAVAGAGIYFSIPLLNQHRWAYILVPIVGIVGLIIYYTKLVGNSSNKLRNKFHETVTTKIVGDFLNEAEFDQENSLPLDFYYQSRLFNTRVDRANGTCYVKGDLGKTSLVFSNLHTEYETVTQTKNGTKTEWHTIFKGVFAVIDPNKKFEHETYILPDVTESTFGGLGRFIQRNSNKSKGELVYLEDPEFEKIFMVYATDPVEARYLITPLMQHRLVELKKHFNRNIHLSFVGNRMYCAISGQNKIFSWNSGADLTSDKTFVNYASNFISILRIVDILDLNTRIWGK